MDVRRLFKVGTSLALIIPKEYVEAHNLRNGSVVKLYFNDALHIELLRKQEILEKLGKAKSLREE